MRYMSFRENITRRFLKLTKEGPQNKLDEIVLRVLEGLEAVYEKGVTRRYNAYASGAMISLATGKRSFILQNAL